MTLFNGARAGRGTSPGSRRWSARLVLMAIGAVSIGGLAPASIAQSSADIARYRGPDRQASSRTARARKASF